MGKQNPTEPKKGQRLPSIKAQTNRIIDTLCGRSGHCKVVAVAVFYGILQITRLLVFRLVWDTYLELGNSLGNTQTSAISKPGSVACCCPVGG